MVGTRHSLPSTAAADHDTANEPPDPAASRKARAALKKLAIDGTGALLGEKLRHEELETYHFRGAVYAVSKGTKAEWIEGEPERYRRRKEREREREVEGSAGVKREDSGYGRSSEDVGSRRDTPVEGTGRRVRFEEGSGEKGARKRRRSMDGDEEEEDNVQGKKRRRSVRSRAPSQPLSSPPSRQAIVPPTIRKVKPAIALSPSRPHANIDRRTPSNYTSSNHTPSTLSNARNQQKDTTMHPSQPPHQPDPIRQTQRNLLALARTNTAIDQHKRELKALLLQRRLRQLRQADPSAPPTPAPLSAGDLAATLEDDYSDDDLLGAPDPPAAPSSPAYALNPHVHDPQRAESGIFAAKRALVAGEEGCGVRARRVQREMRAVRGWETVSPPEEAADGRLPSRSGGAYEADPPRLAVPRPGVPAGAAEADLPDEVRGRLGLFSERERMEVSEAWLGLWAPPRADEDWPGVGSVVGEAGSQEEEEREEGGEGEGDDQREDERQGEGR